MPRFAASTAARASPGGLGNPANTSRAAVSAALATSMGTGQRALAEPQAA